MKRILAAGLLLALTACIDLDEELVSSLGADYATTAQGLTDVTNGTYAAVKGFNGGDTYYGMEQLGVDTWTAADQIAAGGAQNWIYLDDYSAQYNSLGAFLNPQWQAGYIIIARANTVLDNGPKVPVGPTLSQALKDSRLGEAHFMRAWAYFQLVQQYGGLTLNLSSTGGVSTEATRESEDSVYKVIIADLTEAATLLPPSQGDYGRATRGAAQHLLSKVYLTRAYREWNTANRQSDFQQALTLAQSVINSGTYSLVPIYADLWCGMHRAAAPADPGRQSFCDVTTFTERNSEVIWSIQFSIDPVQYTNTATNYNHVVFLSQYDGNSGWAAGMIRDLDNGRPFRRIRPTPYAISLFQQTLCGGTPCGPGVDVVDTRFDGSFQTVWFANATGTNPAGTCPRCTSGAQIRGSQISGTSQVGAAAGSDTAMVYLMYQVPDAYRMSKAYRIATPCTTEPGVDCGRDNDNRGMFGFMHYPSLKKFQDNTRSGGFNDLNGGKDRVLMRLGETYLIAAEAALGTNNQTLAAQMINVLRVRAACDPTPANAPKLCATSHKSDASFMVTANQITLDFLYDEREREMAGELTRWQDLRRPGKDFFLARIRRGNPYAAANIGDKHYFRPIPAQQIQGVTGPAPYAQNPGW
jgi:starch-binding outer membrane protein, SusD/RagB family